MRLGEFLPTEALDGVAVHRVRLPDAESWRRQHLLARSLARRCQSPAKRPDVVQLLSLSPAMTPALVKLRRQGIRIVYTGTMTGALPSNRMILALKRLHFAAPLLLVNSVVASTECMRRYFRDLGVRAPIQVIPNGVDLRTFRPPAGTTERNGLRSSLGIGADDPMILFVGAVTPRKGVDLLLEAWTRHLRRHPTSHLVIAGPERTRFDPAHAEYHARLEALRQTSGAPDRVHYLGVVSNVPSLMRAADLLAFPSRREGMGNVVLEAMASGLPVVLTSFVGLSAELGRPNVDYLLAETDPDSMASQISRLAEDSGLRNEVMRSARGWVEEHMDVERSVDRYADLYRTLAS